MKTMMLLTISVLLSAGCATGPSRVAMYQTPTGVNVTCQRQYNTMMDFHWPPVPIWRQMDDKNQYDACKDEAERLGYQRVTR